MKNIYKKVLILTLIVSPFLALAQFGGSAPQAPIQDISDIEQIITRIVNWAIGLFFAVAVLFIFYAAYLYLTAAGEAEKLTQAKNQLIYAIIAIAIALVATSLTTVIKRFITG